MGADLLAIVTRALTEAAVNDENITYKHLCTAVTQVKPSAIKEVLVQVPNVSFVLTFNANRYSYYDFYSINLFV